MVVALERIFLDLLVKGFKTFGWINLTSEDKDSSAYNWDPLDEMDYPLNPLVSGLC